MFIGALLNGFVYPGVASWVLSTELLHLGNCLRYSEYGSRDSSKYWCSFFDPWDNSGNWDRISSSVEVPHFWMPIIKTDGTIRFLIQNSFLLSAGVRISSKIYEINIVQRNERVLYSFYIEVL